MMNDPIVEEVRQARQHHAETFHFDLQAIYQDVKAQEAASNRCIVAFPPRKRRRVRKITKIKLQPVETSLEPVPA